MKTRYRVIILNHENDKIEKKFDWENSERIANKLDDGVNRNLDHDKYYTEIQEEKTK